MSHNKSVSGGISGKLFAIGKWFSLFFALLALIAIVFGVVYMLSLGSAFKVPSFDDQARQTMISNMSEQQSNIAQQKEQVKLNAEYGDKVISIISKYGIQDVKTAGIINTLMQLPAKYREDFISGWRTYLREGVAYAKKTGVYQAIGNSDGTPGTADMLTQQYINEFSSAVEAANAEKTKSKIERLVIFSLIISAMIIFILTMILPVLVQIEKNTRGFLRLGEEAPASASEAASLHVSAQQAAALCPQCRAPITPGDLFCGSCGADLR